jgi:hypothetical protein
MVTIAHDPPAAGHHVAHRGSTRAEHRCIEQRIDRLARERRIADIEDHEIALHPASIRASPSDPCACAPPRAAAT